MSVHPPGAESGRRAPTGAVGATSGSNGASSSCILTTGSGAPRRYASAADDRLLSMWCWRRNERCISSSRANRSIRTSRRSLAPWVDSLFRADGGITGGALGLSVAGDELGDIGFQHAVPELVRDQESLVKADPTLSCMMQRATRSSTARPFMRAGSRGARP